MENDIKSNLPNYNSEVVLREALNLLKTEIPRNFKKILFNIVLRTKKLDINEKCTLMNLYDFFDSIDESLIDE